ncbi:flavin reductase family protein [Herbaspirillum sp. WKF16]|uniref:flavin reductase family protein n=1 Tax=Herbaspirillum sp. WKF16 TaxID=3028312 RepID=UPI0023A972A2|nr:flavin reductase family protein [Herbaspirillum sp. WKF16]WDZ97272.1 flavin reductase family protein [Herbaspirillum sp. WKF16]
MSHFRPVALNHASRLVNHGPTVLVSAAHAGRRNIMAAAWSMPVEFTPPRIAVVLDKSTWTRELIAASGSFGIIVPGPALMDFTYAVGSESGRDMDKFAHYGVEACAGPELGMPIIERGCSAWLECRWLPEPRSEEAYDTFFGEVVAAAADARIFDNGHWNFTADNAELHTLHHLGAGKFVTAGNQIQARIPNGK